MPWAVKDTTKDQKPKGTTKDQKSKGTTKDQKSKGTTKVQRSSAPRRIRGQGYNEGPEIKGAAKDQKDTTKDQTLLLINQYRKQPWIRKWWI